MEEKKTIKISLSTFFLIIAMIVIVIMGYFMYQFYNEKAIARKESAELKLQVDNLQGKINQISNTINENSTKYKETQEKLTDNDENLNNIVEKQKINGSGYDIILYSNNEVKIIPMIKDLQTIYGSVEIKGTNNRSCEIKGFSGEIEKMYQGNNGTSVDPITFFIMKDGTVQYIQPLNQITYNNNTIPTSFKVDGKIENLNNVVDLKINSNEVIIAITKDGKEIKCWNEWMEEM